MNDQEEPDELQKVEYTVLELQILSELQSLKLSAQTRRHILVTGQVRREGELKYKNPSFHLLWVFLTSSSSSDFTGDQ